MQADCATDIVGYSVQVLWLRGHSVGEIAAASGWTAGAVRGFVHRLVQPPRQMLTLEQRQARLDELKANAPDGSKLREEHFVARRIRQIPMKAAESQREELPEPDLNTRAGRKEAKRRRRIEEEKARFDQEQRDARERGHNRRRGRVAGSRDPIRSSALEHLHERRLLKDPESSGRRGDIPEEERRLEAGLRFRALLAGSKLGGLGAIDYERATTSSGGSKPVAISAYRLECVHRIGALRRLLSDADYVMVEAVVDQDVFVWERFEPGSSERAALYLAIRYQLDVIAVFEDMMTREAFKLRWGEDLPIATSMTIREARVHADLAAEILSAGRDA